MNQNIKKTISRLLLLSLFFILLQSGHIHSPSNKQEATHCAQCHTQSQWIPIAAPLPPTIQPPFEIVIGSLENSHFIYTPNTVHTYLTRAPPLT